MKDAEWTAMIEARESERAAQSAKYEAQRAINHEKYDTGELGEWWKNVSSVDVAKASVAHFPGVDAFAFEVRAVFVERITREFEEHLWIREGAIASFDELTEEIAGSIAVCGPFNPNAKKAKHQPRCDGGNCKHPAEVIYKLVPTNSAEWFFAECDSCHVYLCADHKIETDDGTYCSGHCQDRAQEGA